MMKRILFSLIFLLLFCAPAWATSITVSSFQPGLSWNYGSTQAVTLRIYVSASFVTSDGLSIVASPVGGAGFYKTVTCNVSGTTLTVSSFTIPSTTDATPTTARYTFIFFQGSTKRDVLWSNYQVPVSLGTTISNSQLEIFNRAAPAPPRPGFPTIDQVQQLISAITVQYPTATGIATLTNGSVTVAHAGVTSLSRFQVTSQTDNVSGTLRVVNIVPGVSFDIVSTNLGDNGTVFWSRFP